MWMLRWYEQDRFDLVVTIHEGIMCVRDFEKVARLDCCLNAAFEKTSPTPKHTIHLALSRKVLISQARSSE